MKRIQLIDTRRGFAILGTSGINIFIFANFGNTESVFPDKPWWDSFDSLIHMLVLILINGKFLDMIKYKIFLHRGQAYPGLYIWSSISKWTPSILWHRSSCKTGDGSVSYRNKTDMDMCYSVFHMVSIKRDCISCQN